jgi:SAM-dependent methyltransferase
MAGAEKAETTAIDRALALMEPRRRPAAPDTSAGYLDLLGDEDPTGAHPGRQLMASRVLPLIYERLWRPLGGRVLMGALGPRMGDERRIALEMLDPLPDDAVLDVGCGPGNFTRGFAEEVPDGLVVGLDASRTMLARAGAEGVPDNAAYVLGDAADLPFRDASFDAVCVFAALYLIEHPMRALEEAVRVLAPGGRLGLLTSVNRGPLPTAALGIPVRAVAGIRIFGRDEVTGRLRELGLTGVGQRVAGFGQFVSARKPERRR